MKQLFIGLDVHKKTWAVTIQEDHLILKRFTIDADADLLIGYVARHFRWFSTIGFTVGFHKTSPDY